MEENNPKEINLLQLISSAIEWFKEIALKIFKGLGSILQMSYKFKWISLIIIILCIVVGQYLARPSARIYKAEALGFLYCSDAGTVKEIFKQLENSVATNKQLSLATKLSIPDSISQNIIGIKTFYVIDYLNDGTGDMVDYDNHHSLNDTVNSRMNDRLYVQIKTLKTAHIPVIQDALLQYFDNHPILKTALESKKRNFVDQIKVCDVELKRIDSLAKVEYFKGSVDQIKFENNKLILGEQNKQLFFNELLQLNSIKSETENNLIKFKHPVEFPSNFVVHPIPINNRMKYGVYSIIFGYFLSLLFILLFANRKKILNYLNAK